MPGGLGLIGVIAFVIFFVLTNIIKILKEYERGVVFTLGRVGKRAANGFEALGEYDDDKDGQITRRDDVWKSLRLWLDQNKNGISERGEIVSLNRLDIESISVTYMDMAEVDVYGNETRMRSTFRRRVDGKSVPLVMVDIWFNTLNRSSDDNATVVSQR